ncbi:MAG: nucleotidyltransferase family protein [Muribaculum sp.]|nr:nucleotidyltransferase family protein [Muribaculum sp.]
MYGTPIPESELPEAIDWKAVVALAKKHVVLGIIIDSIQFLPEHLRPSGEISAKMSRFALGLIQANMVMDKTAARLVAFFRQHGIDGVLLKGQGVARYYREPQMRQSGDIDFYVGKTAYPKAVELCRQNLTDDKNECDECEKHFGFNMGGVPVELHRLAARIYSPFRNKRFQEWVVESLERSPSRRTLTVADTHITLPPLDFDAIFIFYHAWCHYIKGGIGLRQLCDWAMIFHSHSSDIDTARLVGNIHRFGLSKGWKLFACIAVNHLGVPEDKMPLYDLSYSAKSEKILEEIISGGNFGYYSEASARTPVLKYGILYGLYKIRPVTGYFFSLFPLIPVEATFLYFNRLYNGAISCTRKSVRKSNH